LIGDYALNGVTTHLAEGREGAHWQSWL